MKAAALALLFAAAAASAEVPIGRVVDDAKAIERIAEIAPKDLPVKVLERVAGQDIELLRGRRPDGSYEFARYERLEAGRESEAFSIQPTDPDKVTRIEMRGEVVYRAVLSVPARRLVVAKNRPLRIVSVEIDYVPERGTVRRTQVIRVDASLAPGQSRTVDFQEIARDAIVRVFARAEKESGYGNLTITLIEPKIFDNPDSPYAAAVSSTKAILKALQQKDVATVKAMARRIVAGYGETASRTVPSVPPPVAVPIPVPPGGGLDGGSAAELQAIEGLLTGTEEERHQGLDRLRQLIRRLREAPPRG